LGRSCSAKADAEPTTAPEHLVLFTLAGVTWEDVEAAHMPALRGLIARGASAAMSIRSATRGSTPGRGYMTLGAGNRAFTLRRETGPPDDASLRLALDAEAGYENGTAMQALARRIRDPRRGAIVQPELPSIARVSRSSGFEARAGSLGQALAQAGVARAVVSAADIAEEPAGPSTMRRSSVLALVDRTGTVDHGAVRGFVRRAAGSPFGVQTDLAGLELAVRSALDDARVVLVDVGESLRADEYSLRTTPEAGRDLRRWALTRSDEMLGRVEALLGPRDQLWVVSVSSPLVFEEDRLTPIVAAGFGLEHGSLTSPTTRRAGIVALTDVAPTVLRAMGAPTPAWVTGTPIRSVPPRTSVSKLAALDRESLFRERFVAVVTTIFLCLLALLGALAFVVFLAPSRPVRVLMAAAYAILAIPPAVELVRLMPMMRLGLAGAALALVAVVSVLVIAADRVPGPRWAGGLALLLLSFALLAADIIAGAPLQLNGIFGYSPIVAGRFYGIGNLGFALLFATGILGFCGLADRLGADRAPTWLAGALALLILLDGLPMLGADFGGVLAGVPAVLVTLAIASRRHIHWRGAFASAVVAVAAGAAALALDLTRAPDARTHLGRFAARIVGGGWPALSSIIVRKARANVGLLGSAWVWSVPIVLSVLFLLVWRRRSVLRDVMPRHPLLEAGLIGSLVAGAVGFATNDSGIAIPGMILGHVGPFFVLVALQVVEPGRGERSRRVRLVASS
jgi:hypothetical protein